MQNQFLIQLGQAERDMMFELPYLLMFAGGMVAGIGISLLLWILVSTR